MASRIKSSLLERLVPILLIGSLILSFFVGVLWQKVSQLEGGGVKTTTTDTSTQAQQPTSGKLSDDQAGKIIPVSSADHVRGNLDAKVYLIEYSDFECPFCSRFHPTAKQIYDEYGGDVAWVYRHFPLEQIHPHARPAALASECIAELGGEDAFWAFADSTFADQTKLSDISTIAAGVGVSGSNYDNCIKTEKFADKIDEQYQGGLTAGVTGTPGNIILNQKGEAWLIPGALPYEQIKPTIDEALGG